MRDRYGRTGFAAMRELVQRVVTRYRLQLDIRQERLFAEWSKFVGDRVGQRTRPETIVDRTLVDEFATSTTRVRSTRVRTRPETIVDRTLVVEVANSSWLHELRLLRPKIVSDLL